MLVENSGATQGVHGCCAEAFDRMSLQAMREGRGAAAERYRGASWSAPASVGRKGAQKAGTGTEGEGGGLHGAAQSEVALAAVAPAAAVETVEAATEAGDAPRHLAEAPTAVTKAAESTAAAAAMELATQAVAAESAATEAVAAEAAGDDDDSLQSVAGSAEAQPAAGVPNLFAPKLPEDAAPRPHELPLGAKGHATVSYGRSYTVTAEGTTEGEAAAPLVWCHPCNVRGSHKKHVCGKGKPSAPRPPPKPRRWPTAGLAHPSSAAEGNKMVDAAAELPEVVAEAGPLLLCDRCKHKRPLHLLMKSSWETHCIDVQVTVM